MVSFSWLACRLTYMYLATFAGLEMEADAAGVLEKVLHLF